MSNKITCRVDLQDNAYICFTPEGAEMPADSIRLAEDEFVGDAVAGDYETADDEINATLDSYCERIDDVLTEHGWELADPGEMNEVLDAIKGAISHLYNAYYERLAEVEEETVNELDGKEVTYKQLDDISFRYLPKFYLVHRYSYEFMVNARCRKEDINDTDMLMHCYNNDAANQDDDCRYFFTDEESARKFAEAEQKHCCRYEFRNNGVRFFRLEWVEVELDERPTGATNCEEYGQEKPALDYRFGGQLIDTLYADELDFEEN